MRNPWKKWPKRRDLGRQIHQWLECYQWKALTNCWLRLFSRKMALIERKPATHVARDLLACCSAYAAAAFQIRHLLRAPLASIVGDPWAWDDDDDDQDQWQWSTQDTDTRVAFSLSLSSAHFSWPFFSRFVPPIAVLFFVSGSAGVQQMGPPSSPVDQLNRLALAVQRLFPSAVYVLQNSRFLAFGR